MNGRSWPLSDDLRWLRQTPLPEQGFWSHESLQLVPVVAASVFVLAAH